MISVQDVVRINRRVSGFQQFSGEIFTARHEYIYYNAGGDTEDIVMLLEIIGLVLARDVRRKIKKNMRPSFVRLAYVDIVGGFEQTIGRKS